MSAEATAVPPSTPATPEDRPGGASTPPAGPVPEGRLGQSGAAASRLVTDPEVEAPILGALVAIAIFLLLPEPYAAGSYGDDALYLSLGRSIAEGTGYREIHAVGQPVHGRYPPGLPALLAVLWRQGLGVDAIVTTMGILNSLAAGVAAGLLWWMGRRCLGVSPAPLAAFAIAPFFLDASLQYHGMALSEPWFVLAWAGALALTYRARWAAFDSTRSGLAGMAGLVLGAGFLFRTQAAVLIPAFAVGLALQRGRRAVVPFLALSIGAVGGWYLVLHGLLLGGAASAGAKPYLADFVAAGPLGALGATAERVAFNFRAYAGWFAPYVSEWTLVGRLVVGAFFALAVVGGVRLVRLHGALVLGVAATAVLVLLWPWLSDRFVLSALPFAGLIVAQRVDVEWRRGPRARRAVALVLGALVLGMGIRQAHIRAQGRELAERPAEWPFHAPAFLAPWTDDFIRASARWAEENTPEDARILVDREPALFLYAARLTVPPDPGERVPTEPGEHLARQVLAADLTHVVIGSPRFRSAGDVEAVRERCPRALDRLGQGEGGYPVYYAVRAGSERCLEGLVREAEAGGGDDGAS